MSIKKTIGAVAVTGGLASVTLVAGLALPAAPAGAAQTAAAVTTARLTSALALRPWPVLRQGANSAWPKVTVRSLQYLLDAHGAKLPVDGVFGARTRAAVLAFQRAHHLTADGTAGAKTWAALVVTVKPGSTGFAVRAIQDQANFRIGTSGFALTVDGVDGARTQLFVKAFQLLAGLTPDGVAGPLTWQALVTESLTSLPAA
jgi:peptidoglycan hydrolase-like protein with peptidoglycan-binding domain